MVLKKVSLNVPNSTRQIVQKKVFCINNEDILFETPFCQSRACSTDTLNTKSADTIGKL